MVPQDVAVRLEWMELRLGTPAAVIGEIARLAVTKKCAAVCVRPEQLPVAIEAVAGSETALCAVIGYSRLRERLTIERQANNETLTHYDISLEDKKQEVLRVLAVAASRCRLEFEYVINIFRLKREGLPAVIQEIQALQSWIRQQAPQSTIKLVGENYWLTPEESERIYTVGREAGADFFVNSTTYTPQGVSAEDLAIMRRLAGGTVRLKVCGGINQFNYQAYAAQPVERIGTEHLREIIEGESHV
ncbi:MAG TPA: hypothetical protein PKL83_00945 [bacterium]|nr:hypothetical protein [bacterium]